MSWFWILVWFIIAAIILGATLWSTVILQRQKKAWEAAAKKMKLKFTRGKFFASPEINGRIGNFDIAIFTAEKQTEDARGKKYITGIELTYPQGIFDGGAVGTQDMIVFMKSLDALVPHQANHDGWNKDHRIFVRDGDVFDAYASQERLTALNDILKTKNAETILLFDDTQAMLRLETNDPLYDPVRLERIINRLTTQSEILLTSKDERKKLKALLKDNQKDSDTSEEETESGEEE